MEQAWPEIIIRSGVGDPAPAFAKATAGKPARCTVGLLTWNAGDDAEGCVGGVLAQTEEPLALVWIDNASSDATPERLSARFPQLPSPLVNARNLGFCAGHNQGLAACRTPYYLALNQDVVLAPDYVRKLCDWLDEQPELALASGLIVMPEGANARGLNPRAEGERLYSAGLVFPRVHFPFELGMGGPLTERYRRRRLVPGVTGSAMMLRVEACRRVSAGGDEIFPPDFFAYHEEVDLALRLARAGWRCGVEGTTRAVHRGQGSGGLSLPRIRAKHFANHWLLALRHESWGMIGRELPYIVRGEFEFWLPCYLKHPWAFLLAAGDFARRQFAARRFYHAFERAFGPTAARLAAAKAAALAELRASRSARGNNPLATKGHKNAQNS